MFMGFLGSRGFIGAVSVKAPVAVSPSESSTASVLDSADSAPADCAEVAEIPLMKSPALTGTETGTEHELIEATDRDKHKVQTALLLLKACLISQRRRGYAACVNDTLFLSFDIP